MITSNNNPLCKQAELYYYDFLNNKSDGMIPKDIIGHIEQCPYCREKINQLDIGLSSYHSVKSENNQVNDVITNLLKLHLAYIGNKVDCKTVKPFLPVILDTDLGIRIPTPITVHLDYCQQCTQDLEVIRSLNLGLTQSCRLSQLLADKKSKDKVSCSQAQAAIPAVSSMNYHETNAQVLKHLCTCHYCRDALYQYRETIHTEYLHENEQQQCYLCNQLSTADFFDYVVPYGLDPADAKSLTFRNSITSHLRDCPTALAKIQELHRTIYEIVERAESEIFTIYNIDKPAKTQVAGESEGLYAGFPISVDIAHREDAVNTEQPASTIKFSAAFRRKFSELNMKPLLKTGIIAVAVLFLAVTFFFKSSVAGAVTIQQICTAIEKAKNIYISTFVPGQTEPTEEKWFSHESNVFITKKGEDLVLWDFENKEQRTKSPGIDSVQITELSDNSIFDIKQNISSFLGLVPFNQISEHDAEWKPVADNELEAATKDTEAYELTWMEKTYTGSTVFHKWEFTIDLQNRPLKIRGFKKLDVDSEYILNTIIVVEYLEQSAIQNVLENTSF